MDTSSGVALLVIGIARARWVSLAWCGASLSLLPLHDVLFLTHVVWRHIDTVATWCIAARLPMRMCDIIYRRTLVQHFDKLFVWVWILDGICRVKLSVRRGLRETHLARLTHQLLILAVIFAWTNPIQLVGVCICFWGCFSSMWKSVL